MDTNSSCSISSIESSDTDNLESDAGIVARSFQTPKKRKYQRKIFLVKQQMFLDPRLEQSVCLHDAGHRKRKHTSWDLSSDDENTNERIEAIIPNATNNEYGSESDDSLSMKSSVLTTDGDNDSISSFLFDSDPEESFDRNDSESHESDTGRDNSYAEGPLFPGSNHTQLSSCISLMLFSTKNSLSKEGFAELVILIFSFLPKPNKFIKSVYKIKQFLKDRMSFKEPIKRHICESCGAYLSRSKFCEKDGCLQNGENCYEFSDLNVEQQIQELFKDDDVCEHVLGQTGPSMPTSQYCDIKDGLEYRRLQQLSPREKICTFTMNTDGVALFKSSNKGSLWPIYLALNELPVKLRYSKKFLLTTHLYCHHEKPDMLAYLVPLMKTLKKLQSEGIMVHTPRGAFLLKFHLLAVALDLPAKAMVLNSKQFNGKFGCSYCLDEGANPPNKPMSRYYPFHESFVLRSHQATINDAHQAVLAGEAVNGIKGASALIALSYFDLTKDVVIDWMHNVLLGVVKTLLSMWFDSTYKGNDFYIGDKIALANRRLTKIQVPDYITRQQKEINNHARWKASECREWLFHYSVPVLTGILAPELIIHYSLLVTGVFILNKESMTDEEIAFAEGCLHDFCKLFPQYYVVEKQTMNLHLLQHLARCVKLHGPLFNYSCFGFESMNNHIKKMVHGTRFVNNQICFAVSMARCLPDLVRAILTKADDDMMHLIHRLNNTASDERMVEEKMLGVKKKYCPTHYEKGCLPGQPDNVWKGFRVQSKIGTLYCREYQRTSSRMSISVMFEDDDERGFGSLQYFLETSDNIFAVLETYNISTTSLLDFHQIVNDTLRKYGDKNLCDHLIKCDDVTEIRIVPVHKLKRKCVTMQCLSMNIISTGPNNLEHS